MEARVAQVEAWWRQHHFGQRVNEAPNPVFLARVLIGALDIAREGHFAQEDWEPALRCIDAILEVERALERPAEDIAAARMNRASVLVNLRRFSEAKTELEDCLQVFQNDPARSAMVRFLAPFGDIALWNILASYVVILCISPYPCATNLILWGHIFPVAPETSSMEGGDRFHLDPSHGRPCPLVT